MSFDTPADNAAFAEAQDLPFLLLSDEDHTVTEAYGALRSLDDPYANWPRRLSYVIDPSGTVRAAYEVSDVASHPQELLEELRRLRAAG